jgi:hypothetical protein
MEQTAARPTPAPRGVAPDAVEFVGRLRRSGLLESSELDAFLTGPAAEGTDGPAELADALVREGLLNEYQAGRLLAGQTAGLLFGEYRVLGCLGGRAYRVEHTQLKRLAAVKVLGDEEDRPSALLPLVQSEVQSLSALRHPGLVLPSLVGEADSGHPGRVVRYLVVDHVHGRDLGQIVRDDGPLPVAVACGVACQAAEALRHVHEHGRTHRRVRPSKLVLTPQGQVKLLGLGEDTLCRGRTGAPPNDEFSAPELRAGRAGDVRSDVYGLGATLYFLLTGQPPHVGDPGQRRALVPLRRLRPEAPLDLEAVVCQMMARDPSDRYPTPLAVLVALNPFRESPGTAGQPGGLPREQELSRVQDALLFAMARMAEIRGLETQAHLLRMQQYVRVLAEAATRQPAFAGRIDATFIRMLERCVVLHDVGKVAIPDHVLLKPGKFDAEERSIMESHTVLGANFLQALAGQPGATLDFLQMAIDIARHHHERFDGTGYPDGLAGEAIPLAARIATFADVYDALRSRLVYKPGLAHAPSRRLILEAGQGQFDPNLLAAFRDCEASFQHIFEMSEPYGS